MCRIVCVMCRAVLWEIRLSSSSSALSEDFQNILAPFLQKSVIMQSLPHWGRVDWPSGYSKINSRPGLTWQIGLMFSKITSEGFVAPTHQEAASHHIRVQCCTRGRTVNTQKQGSVSILLLPSLGLNIYSSRGQGRNLIHTVTWTCHWDILEKFWYHELKQLTESWKEVKPIQNSTVSLPADESTSPIQHRCKEFQCFLLASTNRKSISESCKNTMKKIILLRKWV